jgi:hypothetical protein
MLSEQFGFGGGGAVFCAVPETEVRYSADVLTHVVEWLATFSYDQPVIWFGRGELLGSGARHAAVEPMKGYVYGACFSGLKIRKRSAVARDGNGRGRLR